VCSSDLLFERVDAYYRGSGPVKIMNDID